MSVRLPSNDRSDAERSVAWSIAISSRNDAPRAAFALRLSNMRAPLIAASSLRCHRGLEGSKRSRHQRKQRRAESLRDAHASAVENTTASGSFLAVLAPENLPTKRRTAATSALQRKNDITCLELPPLGGEQPFAQPHHRFPSLDCGKIGRERRERFARSVERVKLIEHRMRKERSGGIEEIVRIEARYGPWKNQLQFARHRGSPERARASGQSEDAGRARRSAQAPAADQRMIQSSPAVASTIDAAPVPSGGHAATARMPVGTGVRALSRRPVPGCQVVMTSASTSLVASAVIALAGVSSVEMISAIHPDRDRPLRFAHRRAARSRFRCRCAA